MSSRGQYSIDLEDSSDLNQIIDDMIEHAKEELEGKIADLEKEVDDELCINSDLNDRIAELEAELEEALKQENEDE